MEEQNEFCAGRAFIDNIFILKQLLEERRHNWFEIIAIVWHACRRDANRILIKNLSERRKGGKGKTKNELEEWCKHRYGKEIGSVADDEK